VARDALKMSTDVLDWAAREAGESLPSLAESIAKRTSERERILQGELTVSQAKNVAARAGIPFGFLFLAEPPNLQRASIPDLRQRQSPNPLSKDFFEVLEDAENKQEWFIEHLRSLGDAEPLKVVGQFSYESRPKPQVVADSMRQALGLSSEDRRSAPTADSYFGLISKRAERAGILVMKSGIVKSNTRRALSPDEFQGFALADRIAPLVFVNGRDYEVAAVFTLVHELAHIWLGESGVTDTPQSRTRGLERLCNEIAAEFLVPRSEFLNVWSGPESVEALATHFRVSRWVIAIRALELGKIEQEECDALLKRRFPRKSSSGGDAFRTIPVRNSKRLTRELIASTLSGRTLIRHAAALLNIRADTVVALSRRGAILHAE